MLYMQEAWIELESRKFGNFFFNKLTGDTFLPPYPGARPPADVAVVVVSGEEGRGEAGEERGGKEETDSAPRKVRKRVSQ